MNPTNYNQPQELNHEEIFWLLEKTDTIKPLEPFKWIGMPSQVDTINLINHILFFKWLDFIYFFPAVILCPKRHRIDMIIADPAFRLTIGYHTPLAAAWQIFLVSEFPL